MIVRKRTESRLRAEFFSCRICIREFTRGARGEHQRQGKREDSRAQNT